VPTSDVVEFDSLALEQQVCFALAITNRAVLGVYRPILAPLGVTHRDAAATGPMSVKQIASALQLEPATLSPMLKRLQAAGLISRTRNAADERGTDVTLTAAGVALRERALTVPPAVVERLGVQLSELELLRDVLSRVNAAAIAAGALDHPKP
jgi:DNA-binding MarR family transcriptional regulator